MSIGFMRVVKHVSQRTGYPLPEARVICEEFVLSLVDFLASKHDVRIMKLGLFIWEQRNARVITHPRTGKKIQVAARVKLRFRPVKRLKEMT